MPDASLWCETHVKISLPLVAFSREQHDIKVALIRCFVRVQLKAVGLHHDGQHVTSTVVACSYAAMMHVPDSSQCPPVCIERARCVTKPTLDARLQTAQHQMEEASREKAELEAARNAATDAQSAHVYQAEQDLAQLEKQYESRLRRQELKVTHPVLSSAFWRSSSSLVGTLRGRELPTLACCGLDACRR